MKTYFFSAVLISFLSMSCTTDEQLSEKDVIPASSNNSYNMYAKGGPAANQSNQYDISGKLFYEILDSYESNYDTSDNVIEHVEAIAGNNPLFASVSTGYNGISYTQLQAALTGNTNTAALVSGTSLSPAAKTVLNNFIVILKTENVTYTSLYNAIVAFESNVSNMTSLSVTDKEKIMIVISIARYGASYHDGGGINPKVWDKLRPSVCGAIAGAETNMASAITLSVSADIASH
jgi:hypothetical protein